MQIMELKKYKQIKRFNQQMEEIKVRPFIKVADEVVNNSAVYGRRSDGESLVSVKYNPVFGTYTVEVESGSESDVMAIIEKIKELG